MAQSKCRVRVGEYWLKITCHDEDEAKHYCVKYIGMGWRTKREDCIVYAYKNFNVYNPNWSYGVKRAFSQHISN